MNHLFVDLTLPVRVVRYMNHIAMCSNLCHTKMSAYSKSLNIKYFLQPVINIERTGGEEGGKNNQNDL